MPITVEDVDAALADAADAKAKRADLVEFRIDAFFPGSEGDAEDGFRVRQLRRLLAESPLPVILTCRSAEEGGDYDGDDADRISLLEKLTAACDTPPAYLDIELAAYARSANLRQKINLCVRHPKQERDTPTRLILSIHDFAGRPADLDRRLLTAYDEPACAVVKVAYRARSLRDNLDLFDLTRSAPKPTIALGMGEFGLPSRVLAPKFGGLLTFASLRESAATAPGQPTVDDLLGMYRFRAIGRETRVYGVIGWPVGHSMSPLMHNAGFDAAGHDGVYLPMPIAADPEDPEGSDASFKATMRALMEAADLHFSGGSVTIPHKERALSLADAVMTDTPDPRDVGAANTLGRARGGWVLGNTDTLGVRRPLEAALGTLKGKTVGIVGAGGAARAAAYALRERGATVVLYNRTRARAEALARGLPSAPPGKAVVAEVGLLAKACCDAFVNCTPVGMAGGPDPTGRSIPVPDMANIGPETVFFDTVYNPIETPTLRAARERGCRTIDGVEMFVHQAEPAFELWTGSPAPSDLFDRVVRARLAGR